MPAYTIEDFVAKAIKTHGDRYDYSAVAYERSKAPVSIICSLHGPFEQQPVSHLRGHGCPSCGNAAKSRGRRSGRTALRITTASFVERAREIHGDRYDYSATVYRGGGEKVEIRCPTHGPFETVARQHLYRGSGCRRCRRPTPAVPRRMVRSMGTGEFIRRAVEVHGERYDYSGSIFTTVAKKIEITCRSHGPFLQTPNNHLYSGAGCPTCGRSAIGESLRSNTDEFIKSATLVHGDRYDYAQVAYSDSSGKVTILCSKHGPFEQEARRHLSGDGCKRCSLETRSLTKGDLLERVADLFPQPYDYALVPEGLTPVRSRIKVTCSAHGPFSVQVGEHIRGTGCARCRSSVPEKQIADALEMAGITFVGQWTHPTLRDKRPLRFDFMLPSTKTLIEYDGHFHFAAVRWAGDTEADAVARLRTTQRHDAMKNEWAHSNGWRLVRVTGRQFLAGLRDAGVLPPTTESHDVCS